MKYNFFFFLLHTLHAVFIYFPYTVSTAHYTLKNAGLCQPKCWVKNVIKYFEDEKTQHF